VLVEKSGGTLSEASAIVSVTESLAKLAEKAASVLEPGTSQTASMFLVSFHS
jgi:hypothetical protein